jgi:pyruvate dehydrogenase E1 component alpha subunit/2-oxoisovalerate dehydrogenase E1 component alpha subunit
MSAAMTDPNLSPARAADLDENLSDDPALGLFGALGEDAKVRTGFPLPDNELLLRMYREMKRIRLLDERMVMLQRQGRVGFYGACTGQEAAVVATGLAAAKEDWIFPALRENAVMLVRGFPLVSYIAQVYGSAVDTLKGRQMPAHISSRSVNQVSWSSCIATQLPHAVGAAWAAKLKGDKVVTLGFVGDGGTSEADFHAALNFAGVYKLPTVLICQNNQWAISVPLDKQTASPTIAVKARAYGIPGIRVDGNDVLAVHHVLSDAIARARLGEGPTFVELLTYRVAPHSTSDDPTRYRSNAEVEVWLRRDPLDRLTRYLRDQNLLTESDEQNLELEAAREIREAIDECEAAGPPALSSLFEDVYAEQPWHLVEQWESLQKLPPRGPGSEGKGH